MFRKILKLLFLPVLIPVAFIYRNDLFRPRMVLYSWYRNRRDYDDIMKDCEFGGYPQNYEEWLEDAEVTLSEFDHMKTPFAKIVIRPKPLKHWLRSNNLGNNPENREKYINFVFDDACKTGIESHLHRK